ncbi:MAG: extracellular solute-binding protein [Alphaproteobacteria bacterium]
MSDFFLSPRFCSIYIGLTIWLILAGSSFAAPLTVAVPETFDSSTFTQAFLVPYGKDAKITVASVTWSGRLEDLALRRSLDGQSSEWDLALIGDAELDQACQNGAIDRFDLQAFRAKEQFIAAATHRCGLGAFIYPISLIYDSKRFTGREPDSWAALWDIKRFPGKRILPGTARYTMEIALLADGVPPREVYSVLKTTEGIERAFKKLADIKNQIQWATTPEAVAQSLASGEVAMAIGSFNRAKPIKTTQGIPLKTIDNCNIYSLAYWAIPKGTKHKKQAYELVGYFTTAIRQRAIAENLGYGPTRKTVPGVNTNLAGLSLNGTKATALMFDSSFWSEQGSELEARFKTWLGTNKPETIPPATPR